ncbi:LOW QUALITY PROTEIN: DUF1183 domain protein [Purpureocillium lavendulum]|uniref:DUF1183 domain protein n=1 Tax=Purpureocillium lavendulum TaxID=1247861 RepID=A0AB34G593_9HYPO|nr:LOW QUALITY PROTEIN: DUF1183 domain protein [Purpureocillium lavendulum]
MADPPATRPPMDGSRCGRRYPSVTPSPPIMDSRRSDENTPLLPTTAPATSTAPDNRPRNARTVTFSADPVTRTFEPDSQLAHSDRTQHAAPMAVGGASASGASFGAAGPPVLAALNSKLRRRNSHSAIPSAMQAPIGAKIGPQRSTKKTEKLKLLPNPDIEDGEDEESGRDVYSQYTRIKDPTARRDAARLGKGDRARLPRVTAYCTANRYEMESLMRFLKGRGKTRSANPKLIDECIYTPYAYGAAKKDNPVRSYERRHSTGGETFEAEEVRTSLQQEARHDSGYGDEFPENSNADVGQLNSDELLGPSVTDDMPVNEGIPDFDTQVHTPEVFLFDYGVVVIWGMTEAQEARFLKDIAKFELEKLAPDDVETEHFNFYYTREYQARIYNDFITLRDRNNYMTKLAISHALAQSVKTSLFEELIASTIDTCKDIPTQIALTGKIDLSRSQINMQIGELFILRINIHLNGSVLDTPELFWVEPQLEPVYQAVRSYLEMDQRVGLLTERLDVIADLLAVLKDQLSHGHGEKLEWIVIVLIAMEIVVAAVNIVDAVGVCAAVGVVHAIDLDVDDVSALGRDAALRPDGEGIGEGDGAKVDKGHVVAVVVAAKVLDHPLGVRGAKRVGLALEDVRLRLPVGEVLDGGVTRRRRRGVHRHAQTVAGAQVDARVVAFWTVWRAARPREVSWDGAPWTAPERAPRASTVGGFMVLDYGV